MHTAGPTLDNEEAADLQAPLWVPLLEVYLFSPVSPVLKSRVWTRCRCTYYYMAPSGWNWGIEQ